MLDVCWPIQEGATIEANHQRFTVQKAREAPPQPTADPGHDDRRAERLPGGIQRQKNTLFLAFKP